MRKLKFGILYSKLCYDIQKPLTSSALALLEIGYVALAYPNKPA